MPGQLILVTGITGFIAGHVANQLLAAGYRVRGTTRGEKAKQLSDSIKVEGLEFFQVDDIATSDLTKALQDVYAVIHVASPLPGRTSVDDAFNSAIEGTQNILKSTVKAGIEKLVVTSTFGNVLNPSLEQGFHGRTFTSDDWGTTSKEEALKQSANPFYIYFASKLLTEKAIWEFAREHPQLDIASIMPGFVFGEYADYYPLPASATQLGTNGLVYPLISGQAPNPIPPWIVNVKDVAKAHVLSLNVPRKPVGHKRYLVNGGNLTWRQAVEHLNKVRPEIKTISPTDISDLPGPASTLDTKKTVEELGFGEFIKPEDTVVSAVDALIALKATWKA